MNLQQKNTGTDSPILVWDTSDVDGELESRLQDEYYYDRENWLEEYQKESGRKEVNIDDISFQEWINENKKEQIQNDIFEDTDYWEAEWDLLIDSLEEILVRKNPRSCKWKVEGYNMGWRHRSGYKYIDCENKNLRSGSCDAGRFLQEILPDTDCTFRIYDDGRYLRIKNYHHDAPTGETYLCIPCSEEEWEKNA